MGILYPLRQSTASQYIVSPPIVDEGDMSPLTGLTIAPATCKLSKAGASSSAKNESSNATHIGEGRYKIPLDATDTNTLGPLTLTLVISGALIAWVDCWVYSAADYDAKYAETPLPVALTSGAATALAEEVADAVWDEDITEHQDADSAGEAFSSVSAEAIADAVWDEDITEHADPDSAGEALSAAGDPFSGTNDEVTPGAEPMTHGGLLRMIYNRSYRRSELTDSTLRVYVKDSVGGSTGVLTQQTVSDDGTTQVQQQSTYPS